MRRVGAESPETVTRPVAVTPAGGFASARDVLPLVYEQLKGVARARMSLERARGAGHTLQATAVVHEAFARLSRSDQSAWAGRRDFFLAAAREIERVLVDHARHRYAVKRGGDPNQGGYVRVPLDVVDLARDDDGGAAVALNAAILRLEQEDEQAAAVVRLRFFVGLTAPEAALALGISERTVVREWTFARAYLAAELEGVQ